jgi:cytidine deaminase
MTDIELMALARKARKQSYCPYSGFAVGAALLDCSGKVWTGCNIENAAFGPTNCAERTAFFKAISEGVHGFDRIAISGGPTGQEPKAGTAPCGVCRQVMAEFCKGDFAVYLAGPGGTYETYTLAQLLPMGFSAEAHMAEK